MNKQYLVRINYKGKIRTRAYSNDNLNQSKKWQTRDSFLLFLVYPIWPPVFFLFFYNEPESGAGIDPGMALTPLPSSI